MRQDITSLNKWFNDNGDYTHNINYELNDDSVVIDLGGYYGLWIDEILKKNTDKLSLLNPHHHPQSSVTAKIIFASLRARDITHIRRGNRRLHLLRQ